MANENQVVVVGIFLTACRILVVMKVSMTINVAELLTDTVGSVVLLTLLYDEVPGM